MADRTVSVSLVAKVQGFVAGVGTASRAAKQFGGELDKLGQSSPKKFNDITMALAGAGVGLLAIAGYAAKTAASFDKQMSHVGAVAEATAGQLGQLRSAALQAGKDTSFSATEAAKAEEELAKAGISTTNILGGGLKGALALAAAGSLDLAEAADIAAKAMNTFGLSGGDVGHIADVLSASANKSATDVHEMGEALKMGGLAARNSGLSLEQTVGVLSAFADRALVGSDAGTSLKTMLQFLANPTDKASAAMRELGISVYDQQGKFVGVTKLADILQQKLGTLSEQQRNAALATIFGSDATRAATVLYELGSSGVQKYIDAVDDQGAAQETAAAKTDNLAGDLERLRGTVETLAIEAGSGANGGLRDLVKVLDWLATRFLDLPGAVQTGSVLLAGIGGSALLATAGFLKARQTVSEFMIALEGMGPKGEKAATALGKIGKVGGAVGLVALAVVGVYEGMKAFGNWADAQSEPVSRDIDKMSDSLQRFANTGRAAGELAKAFGQDMSGLAKDLDRIAKSNLDVDAYKHRNANKPIIGGRGANPDALGPGPDFAKQQREDVAALDKSLANMANNGGATQAKLALERLRTEGQLTNAQFDQLIAQLPQYTAAAQGAAASNTGLANGFGDAADNAGTLERGLLDAVNAGQKLTDVFNQLNGANLNLSDAEIAAESATRGLQAALKDSKGSLDLTTEAGGKAQSALNDLARKGAEAAQAMYEQTGSVDKASAEFEKYRAKLIQVLVDSGRTRAEAEALANQYMQMPPVVATRVQLYGAESAQGQVQALKDSLNRIPGTKTITISVREQLPPGISQGYLLHNAAGGTVDYFGNGGEWHGAQIAPAGSMRVWAEPETGGEGYIPLSAAKRNAAIGTMAAINRRFGNPLGAGGGMPGSIQLVLTGGDASTQALLRTLRTEVRTSWGGNVQMALGGTSR